jgi:hypothetical protein
MKSWAQTFVLIFVVVQTGRAHTLELLPSVEPFPKGTGMLKPPPEVQPPPPTEQFMSTVQFAFQENTSEMMERSRRVVKQQFAETLEGWPELAGKPYEVKTMGNEVVFYLSSDSDMQQPMQRAVSRIVERINGKVRTRGRSQFFRTALSQPVGGYLETVVNDSHTKIVSISAQSVSLRNLLKQLQAQLGSLSYMVPGECAERPVDWSFGGGSAGVGVSEPKSVETVMSEIATLFGLKFEKKNGTHIFSGECPLRKRSLPSSEMVSTSLEPVTAQGLVRPSVYVPVTPIGN